MQIFDNDDECAPSGDDTVTSNERLCLSFWAKNNNGDDAANSILSDFVFKEADHTQLHGKRLNTSL